ncbi:MAG: enoyl-CoA hydratase/isomerase family protein [Actinomycetota bacterium]|nr:enoyl-CoA hydratase/isomerase family protein [Actinomycetota bacterium]
MKKRSNPFPHTNQVVSTLLCCAGADLPIFDILQEVEKAYSYLRNDGGTINRIMETAELPWIAAVKGTCVAGGLEFALCCDMIVAGENSMFGVLR